MLRDYQREALVALADYWKRRSDPCVLQLATGAGKSWIIAEIVKQTGQPVLVLQPSKEILEQNYEKILLAGVDAKDVQVCSASAGSWKIGKITLATIGTIAKYWEYCQQFKIILVDECVDGDCEVLTPDGWVKISDAFLSKPKIMQYNLQDGSVEFVQPTRWVKNDSQENKIKVSFSGDFCGDKTEVIMTKNHRQPVIWKPYNDRKNRSTKKVYTASTLPRSNIEMILASNNETVEDVNPLYLLHVAIAADGHCEKRKNWYWHRLAFRRERKIERAEELLRQCGIKYDKKINSRGDTYFSFRSDFDKGLHNIPLDKLTPGQARTICNELLLWDGCRSHNAFDTMIKTEADFAQAVAFIGGMSTTVRLTKTSKNEYKNYRVRFLNKKTKCIESRNMHKEEIEYDKPTYCVSVPSTFFVVRKNNFVFVTGNCDVCPVDRSDSQYVKFFNNLPGVRIVGLTATPWRNQIFQQKYMDPKVYCRPLTRIYCRDGKNHPHGEWFWKGGIIYKCDIERLQNSGYLSPTVYHIAEADWSFVRDVAGRVDFDTSDMTKFMDIEANTSRFTQAIVWCMKNNLKTIVFSPNIDMNFRLAACIRALGGTVETMDSDNDTRLSRTEKMQEFRDGKFQFLVNVGMVGRGVDVPSVDAVVLCRPTKSLSLYMQYVGRCLRIDPANPNKKAYILDLSGNVDRFGTVEGVKLGRTESVSKFGKKYGVDTIFIRSQDGQTNVWDQVS